MSTRRGRSSTEASYPLPGFGVEFITQLIEHLDTLKFNTLTTTYPDLRETIQQVKLLKQHLVAAELPLRPQDDFRHNDGFSILLRMLRIFSGFYNPNQRSQEEKIHLFELLESVLGVLGFAFRDHPGNQRYFRDRVEGGGWPALEQTIASIGVGGSESDIWSEAQLFGRLLSFALDDKRFEFLCQTVAALHPAANRASTTKSQEAEKNNQGDGMAKDSEMSELIDNKLGATLGENALLWNADIIPTIIDFWRTVPRTPDSPVNPAALVVILTLTKISSISQHNLLALHTTGILSTLLPLAFEPDTPLGQVEKLAVQVLCSRLISSGISALDDAHYLVSSKSAAAADFLLSSMKDADSPAHIQFDLSLNGHASIEVKSLGRTFPPPSSVAGYTFTAWFNVDHFDPNSHTTIFGAFDATQACFVLAYLEKDTRNLILQTSITPPSRFSRPSVRFKSFAFAEHKWYHIAIAHRRPRISTSSKAILYVNGEMVEQVTCKYPAAPPSHNSSTDSFASFTSSSASNRTNPVQAFLGTPKDLSGNLGRGAVFSRWSLASAHLLEDVLSDDLVAVYYRLGPRYNGNFQDCLGSFQTYEASAQLGMRNELMHPGKDEASEILGAIRDKAGLLNPESRILLSILPSAVLGASKGEDSQLVLNLNRSATKELARLTHHSGMSIAINAAVPCINEALTRSYGTPSLIGDPVVCVPQSLDDAMWRLGGFTGIALKMVENANDRESIVRATELLFESIKGSWRNSEAMEQQNGYAILGALLRGKLGAGTIISSVQGADVSSLTGEERDQLGLQLLSLVLDFVGYKHGKPEESFIINPLAYRTLLVDFDMWRKTAYITQKLYYKQFITFGVHCKDHHFNIRRLHRMRIVKRFLDAMKAETFSVEIFPSFMEALTCLVKCSMTPEIFRALALFITYAYHKPTSSVTRTPRSGTVPSGTSSSRNSIRRPTISTLTDGNDVTSSVLTKRQMGNKVLEMYTGLLCERGSTANIKKFARTVTNKWLLHLLTEDDPEVVVFGSKILARLIVVHGPAYVTKFSAKTGGFTIMRHQLKRWWDIPPLWPIMFSILFAHDVAEIDFERPFELYSLLETFGKSRVVYPDALPVITAMMQLGLRDVLRNQDDPDSPLHDKSSPTGAQPPTLKPPTHGRNRSMSLTKELESRKTHQPKKERLGGQALVLHTVIRFFAELHASSQEFKDFAVSSDYIRLLLAVLFPVIVSTDSVSPDVELNSRDSALTFEGDDVIIRPISRTSTLPAPIVRTSIVETHLPPSSKALKAKSLRRGSSFILLTSQPSEFSPSSARLNLVMSPKKQVAAQQISNSVIEGLLELVVNVFIDKVMNRKEFPGFGLYLYVPPGFQEHQAYFQSYLLRNTMQQLGQNIQLNQKSLWEPKVIQNMARFVTHMGEAVYEGWFLSGSEPLLDFAGNILEYLQQPEVAKIKSVRLCSQAIATIRSVFLRVVLLRLSELDSTQASEQDALAFLKKLSYWQTVVLSAEINETTFLNLICYQLYMKLVDLRTGIRLAAADLWRTVLMQKPDETSQMFHEAQGTSDQHRGLEIGFNKLTQVDNETFVDWVDENRAELDALFFGAMSTSWEVFVNAENEKTEGMLKSRVKKRREKLTQWHRQNLNDADVLFRHGLAANTWMKNIYASEHLKHQRAQQDQQDQFGFLASEYGKMDRELHRPCAVFDNGAATSWKLDRSEGRNRMRLRILPDHAAPKYDYQPKRRATESGSALPQMDSQTSSASIGLMPIVPTSGAFDGTSEGSREAPDMQQSNEDGSPEDNVNEDDFELIDDPNDPGEDGAGYEDKNRKVMRSLQRNDQVHQVFNISQIIGMEAVEGLLIIGKNHMYLIDNVFQRSDGEIVNVSMAPKEERDPYLDQIAGSKAAKTALTVKTEAIKTDQDSRSWKWSDVISVSKRRFLFRDVAVEVFFTDGRSYLLTAISPTLRDSLHSKLTSKAPHTAGNATLPNSEDIWRVEALQVADEAPSTFGAKFGNIFNTSAWNPAMRRWAKGEMSNFHYLMLVNTMAGRTFNDLTQYPVFPWILADYTSEELDLNNPASFRDLSKPMGAQHPVRQKEFIEKYKAFAEMDIEPYHYSTHYSSSTTVSSFLIRLQPFTHSHLLLQDGKFDHPDRIFHSIAKAWRSASRDNATDVRELIPEFFYLPEFLTNGNGYDFGLRQGDAGGVDNVDLPPWAKGDPKIFIAKHREALESPHVSKYLHQWIDLIFGYKQRGEAAVESLNVFNHLSYHGARNLDNIEDPIERIATINVIHGFGQTPHQVFSKPHPAREDPRHRPKRLDTAAECLICQPSPISDSHERITSLIHVPKLDRLISSTALRLNLPPVYDKYLEWGFADNSVRFFFQETRKLAGLFENLHQGQLSCALFASSQLLITAGEDCVISAHTVVTSSGKPVELQPRSSMFGHRSPVTVLAVSPSFSTMLSASADGTVLLWDLNQLSFVRKLTTGRRVETALINDVTGDILLARGPMISLWTLNGELILEQNVCDDHDDWVMSASFWEGSGSEWVEGELVFTGQRRGVANVWRKEVVRDSRAKGGARWGLKLVKRMEHRERAREWVNIEAGISCVRPMAQAVFTGDEDGRVYEWKLEPRER